MKIRAMYGYDDKYAYVVSSMPVLKGCYTQAKSLDVLMERIKEVIELCLEMQDTLNTRVAVLAQVFTRDYELYLSDNKATIYITIKD